MRRSRDNCEDYSESDWIYEDEYGLLEEDSSNTDEPGTYKPDIFSVIGIVLFLIVIGSLVLPVCFIAP